MPTGILKVASRAFLDSKRSRNFPSPSAAFALQSITQLKDSDNAFSLLAEDPAAVSRSQALKQVGAAVYEALPLCLFPV